MPAARKKRGGGRNAQGGKDGRHGFVIYLSRDEKEALAKAAALQDRPLGTFVRTAALAAVSYTAPARG